MLAERTYRRPLRTLPLRDALALVLTDLTDRPFVDDGPLWELVADESPLFPVDPAEAAPSWFLGPITAAPIEVRTES